MTDKLEIRLIGITPQDPKYFDSPEHPNKCDGCGKTFEYPIHKHFGYNSCSVECDSIIDEYLLSDSPTYPVQEM